MNRARQKRLSELLSDAEPARVLQGLELARSLDAAAAAAARQQVIERVVTDLGTGRADRRDRALPIYRATHTILGEPGVVAVQAVLWTKLTARTHGAVSGGLQILRGLHGLPAAEGLWRDLIDAGGGIIRRSEGLERVRPKHRPMVLAGLLRAIPAPPRAAIRRLSIHGVLRMSGVGVLPACIAGMTGLRALDLSRCSLPSLPDAVLDMAGLEELDLSLTLLRALPDGLARLRRLRVLRLKGAPIRTLPPVIGLLSGLEVLDLSSTPLTVLPDAIARLPKLKQLILTNCASLKEIPAGLWAIKPKVRGCVLLQSIRAAPADAASARRSLRSPRLPEVRAAVDALRSLDDAGRAGLRPAVLEMLTRWLTYRDPERVRMGLSLLGALSDPSLADALWQDSLLTIEGTLGSTLSQVHEEHRVWVCLGLIDRLSPEVRRRIACLGPMAQASAAARRAAIEKLPGLVELRLDGPMLQVMPVVYPRLPALICLEVDGGMGELSLAPGATPALQRLSIRKLSALTLPSLPMLAELTLRESTLSLLDLTGCASLASLHLERVRLKSLAGLAGCPLRSLTIRQTDLSTHPPLADSATLESLTLAETALPVPSLAGLPALRTLRIESHAQQRLPDGITGHPCLTTIETDTASAAASLRHISAPGGILHIDGPPGLTAIAGDLGQRDDIHTLKVTACPALASLPDSLTSLGGLTSLIVSDCPALTSLPDLSPLAGLKTLHLQGTTGLESVPGLARLSGLRELDLSGVQLDAVPRLPRRLRALTLPLSALSGALPRLYERLDWLSRVRVSGARSVSVEIVGSDPDERLAALLRLLHKTDLPIPAPEVISIADLTGDTSGVTALPEVLGEMWRMETLDLSGMADLESLPESLLEHENLQTLVLRDCPGLEEPEWLVALEGQGVDVLR